MLRPRSMRNWPKRRNWSDIIHVSLLIAQIVAVSIVGIFAFEIQSQNYTLQKALYDFTPQVSGFVDGYIYVYQGSIDAVATIEILIDAPHSGNVTLTVNNFFPQSPYLDPQELNLNYMGLAEPFRDTTYPQACRFRGNVNLNARICPEENLTNIVFFPAGLLEFQIFYYDVPKNTVQTVLLNGTVMFEFPQ